MLTNRNNAENPMQERPLEGRSFLMGNLKTITISDALNAINPEHASQEGQVHIRRKNMIFNCRRQAKPRIISTENFQRALSHHRAHDRSIQDSLVELGIANEEEIALELTANHGFPYLPLSNYELSPEAIALIPGQIAMKYCLISIDRIGNTLSVAMANPLHAEAVKTLEALSHCYLQIFVCKASEIREAIALHYKTHEAF